MGKKKGKIPRSFYYYDLALFDYDKKAGKLV